MRPGYLKEYRFKVLCAAFFCCLLLMAAYFLEFVLKLNPCILCLFQRYMLWGMAFCFILGFFDYHKKTHRSFYLYLSMLLAILGLIFSGRQLWLQQLPPDKVPSCTAGLERLFEIYPFFEALKMGLSSGECAKETFFIFGLSLAAWTFIAFVILLLFIIFIKVRDKG